MNAYHDIQHDRSCEAGPFTSKCRCAERAAERVCGACERGAHALCDDDGRLHSPRRCVCAREYHGEAGIGVVIR